MGVIASAPSLLAAGLGGRGHYISWGFVKLSLANLVVIALMVAVFVLALVVPFPSGKRDR